MGVGGSGGGWLEEKYSRRVLNTGTLELNGCTM